MINLNTKQIFVTPQMQTPTAMPVQFVKPLSYEFRVAEHLKEDNTVDRIGLQVQIHEHDEYGVPIIRVGWMDVPRVKLKNGIVWAPDFGTTP
jgi:hypothetical protein